MIKKLTLSLLFIILVLQVGKVSAQCGWTDWSGTNYPAIPCGAFSGNYSVGSGTYTYFTGYNGSSYTISTCGSPFDTQLTIYDENPGWTARAYNDDYGPDCPSNQQASLTFTASYTGNHIAIVNRYNCAQHDFTGTSAILKFRENPPEAPAYNPDGGGTTCQNVPITLNRVSTPPAGLTYHWVNNPSSTASLGTGATYNPPTNALGSYTYYVRPQSGSGCWGTASAGVGITVTPPSGNPAVFGIDQWNTYAYIGGNIDLTGVYAGFYVETALSYNSLNRWDNLGSPSSASGYSGCTVGVDNHVVVSKRQGFPCSQYQLSMPNNDDDVRVYVNGGLVASGGCCNSLTGVFWTGWLGATSYIEVRHAEGGGGSNQSLTLNPIAATPGNPAVYGNGLWNVYAWNAGDGAGTAGEWVNNYSGYYTSNTLSFNTATHWTDSPSQAPGYTGCTVGIDNHSWSAKRQDFPCALYQIDVNGHDDMAELYINGGLVWQHIGCCDSHGNVWTGVLSTSDQVEFRGTEGGGGTNGQITLIPLSPTAINGGTITYGGSIEACVSYDPPGFGSSADASGGTSAAITNGTSTYQWQLNGIDIGSANGTTYDAPNITGAGSYAYRRRVTDKCGVVGYSNTFTIVVAAQSVIPTLNAKTPNVSDICQGQAVSATMNAGSGGSTGAIDIYEFSTDGGSSWSAYTPGNNIATGSATGSVQIRVSRTGGGGTGCNTAGPNTIATWTVSPQAVAPTLNVKTPNLAAICQGDAVNASANAGSGGSSGANDVYEYSINGGSNWSAYTPGANINTATATISVQVRASRTGGTGTGCNTSGPNVIATWDVNTPPSGFIASVITTTPLCFRGTAQIEVPTSNASLTYQLRENTTNIGSSQAGNGGMLTFTTNSLNVTNANYNVLATNVLSCTTSASVGAIAVDVLPADYASNGDVKTCYVNSNDYIEFRSPNGIMVGINSNGQNLGDVTVTEYAGSPVNIQACGTYQPWYITATLGRHWKIEPQIQPVGTVSVRLYFDNDDYTALQSVANINANPNDDITALGSLDLSKYSNSDPTVVNGTFDDNCGSGTYSSVYGPDASGSITALSDLGGFTGTGRYIQYSFTGFSEFWLSGTDNVSPLPIELTSFTATCIDGNVKLDWTTATEINNEKFIIDRSSDLQTWEEVFTQPGAGNSNQSLSYSGLDERPLDGLSYYRLTQRDYDGAFETFEPISITCYSDGKGNSLMVYPNPATDNYTVSVYVTEDISGADIYLADMNGKTVMLKNINLVKGNNEFKYDATMLQPSTYVLYIKSNKLELKPVKVIIK